MNKSLLIVFAKNPDLGKVKTRLAATVGNEKALAIYHLLLSHTREISHNLPVDKAVFYSDYIDKEDKWENNTYLKYLQEGGDLGKRMLNAAKKGFEMDYSNICIIGTDNLEITEEIIATGFDALLNNDAVIGPAFDGGYYLLGMKKLYVELFENKQWSTESVFESSIADFKRASLTYFTLPTLHDIDTEEDWNMVK